MGILIGEKDWRGRGAASEVIIASAMWLKENFGINKIFLGLILIIHLLLKHTRRVALKHFLVVLKSKRFSLI